MNQNVNKEKSINNKNIYSTKKSKRKNSLKILNKS